MPWRVIDRGEETWHVSPAAERQAHEQIWKLMLSFRAQKGVQEPRSFWAEFPMESHSKSALFHQADKISDDALLEVLAQYLS